MPHERKSKTCYMVNSPKVKEKLVFYFLRLKDTKKDMLKRGGVFNTWEDGATDKLEGRKLINNTCAEIDNDRKEDNERKRLK